MAQTNEQISSYMLEHTGILAVLIFDGPAAKREGEVFAQAQRDPPRLKAPQATMVQAAMIAERCRADTMRVIFGEEGGQETMIYGHDAGRTIVVVIATGDAVMKSIRRMMSRCMKQGRALPRRRMRSSAAVEPTPPPLLEPVLSGCTDEGRQQSEQAHAIRDAFVATASASTETGEPA